MHCTEIYKSPLISKFLIQSYGQYSPGQHHYEMKYQIKYLANPEDEDKMLVIKTNKHDNEFIDENLKLEYYPDRESVRFNVNIKNIDMPRSRSSKHREYELSTDVIDSDNSVKSALDRLVERVTKLYGPEQAQNITSEDLEFESEDDLLNDQLSNDDDYDILNFDNDK